MSKPHLFYLGALSHVSSFQEGHVLILLCLFLFLRLAVHSFADKKICPGGIFYNSLGGPCIRTIGKLDSLPGRA